MAPKRKTDKQKQAAAAAELAPVTPEPAAVVIPPIVEDCTGVTVAADPVCAAAVGENHLFLGHHNGIVTMHSTEPGGASTDIVEIAAHRGSIKAMMVLEHSATPPAAANATTGGGAATPPTDDTEILLTASADGTMKAHAIPSGQWIMTFTGHEGPVECFTVSACKKKLLSGGSDGRLAEWDIASGELLNSIKCHVGRITAICVPTLPLKKKPKVLENGELEEIEEVEILDPPVPGTVITASDDTLAQVVHPASRKITAMMRGESPVLSMAYIHPNVFLGCADGKIRGFNVHTAQNFCLYSGHSDAVNALLVARGRLFSASDDTTVKLWSPGSWQADHTFNGHVKSATCLAAKRETEARDPTTIHHLYSGGFDNSSRAWDLAGVVKHVELVEKVKADAAPKPAKKVKKDAAPKKRR